MRYSLILLLSLSFVQHFYAQTDVDNCADHPIITRYPGATIQYCDIQNYKEYQIATGDETSYRKIEDWVATAGKNTRLYYSILGDRTLSEVYKNYINALEKGDFDLIAKGFHTDRNVSPKIGGDTWLVTFYKSNPYPSNKGIHINQGSGTVGGTFYIAAKLSKEGEATVYAVISGKQYTDKETVVLLDIIEEDKVENDLIKVDADYMAKKLLETGHVALQNVLFDFNKASLQEVSKPLLEEIAKMLKANPTFNIFVVGHSDMVGEVQYNMDLSSKRAKTVCDYLINNLQIKSDRLSPYGVGPLAPVASNTSDKGRTKNRRVELVLKSK